MNTNHLNRRFPMNTKLFKLLTAGTLAVLLSSCGDNVIDNDESNPVQTKATLNVLVRDASTGNPLEASIKLLSTGESNATSAATGAFSFKSVYIGEHKVLIEKDGYASAVYDATIGSITNWNTSIAEDAIVNANLYPLTSSLDGYVFYEDTNGVRKPAEGARVRVVIKDPSLVERVFEATTIAGGKFAFPRLPAVSGLYSLQILDWQTYKAIDLGSFELLEDGLAAHITSTDVIYTNDKLNSLFDLLTTKAVISSSDTLELEFSGDINATKFSPSMVTAISYTYDIGGGYYPGDVIPTQKIVSGKKLRLVPLGAINKWPSSFGVEINKLEATSGKVLLSTTFNNITVSDKSDPFELIKYNKNLTSATDTIILEFSLNIDVAKFKPENVTITNGIIADKIVEGKKLKLVPINKLESSDFDVEFNLTAVNGKNLSSTVTFVFGKVDLTAEQVTGLVQADTDTSDYNSQNVKLRWNKLANATNYRIYAKASLGYKKEIFVLMSTVPATNLNVSKNYEEYTVFLPCGSSVLGLEFLNASEGNCAFANDSSVVFLVQAFNSYSETNLNNAKSNYTLAVKDTKKPALSVGSDMALSVDGLFGLGSMANVASWLSSASSSPNSLPGCIGFPEPMDTTMYTALTQTGVKGEFVNNSGTDYSALVNAKLDVRLTWHKLGNTSSDKGDLFLCLDVSSRSGGEFADPIDVKYRIYNLKDKAQNPVEAYFGTTKVNYLDIRFKTTP